MGLDPNGAKKMLISEFAPVQQEATHTNKLKVLVVAGLFPPYFIGGAEMSAFNSAQWLLSQGHEVGVLTTASSPEQVVHGEVIDGLRVWRVLMPRPYAMIDFQTAPVWQKPIWHLQDHFDPRNRAIIRPILDAFRPDIINAHIVQGVGHNIFSEIADRDIPVVYFLHDLGLACYKQSMFVDGKDCEGQCMPCRGSSRWKAMMTSRLRRLGFCSPSQANLDAVSRYFPMEGRRKAAILNPNKYPPATAVRQESIHMRFLYVGRLQPTKGINMLLEVLRSLSRNYVFTITVVGSGPDEQSLRSLYSDAPWCKFTGFITQPEISNIIANSDVFLIPSIWAENSPGVVIHALGLGLPVVGSRRGGIPELIKDGVNGELVEAGNKAAWADAIERLLQDRSIVYRWRKNTAAESSRFDQESIGNEILSFMRSVIAE